MAGSFMAGPFCLLAVEISERRVMPEHDSGPARGGSSWFARLYDVVMVAADRVGLRRRRRALAEKAHGRVLEIGAGTGLEFPHYRADAEVVAIEPDQAMIRRADRRRREAAAPIALVVADARALPFRDEAFDSAVVALAFCTIPEPERAAGEMRRVLRPSATAYILEHVRARHEALAVVQERLTPLWSRLAGGCELARPTARTIAAAGFDVAVTRADLDGTFVELEARARV